MKVLFNEEKMSLIVEIDQEIPTPQHVKEYAIENQLNKKQEIHFTLVNFNQGKIILNQFEKLGLSKDKQKFIKTHLFELAQKTYWKINPKEKFLHLKKRYNFPNKTVEKESIIELVDIEGLKEFIDYINKLLSLELESFGHITLFAKSSDPNEKTPGIGVASEKELESLIAHIL
jgi:ERCC4-related helicase